MPTIPYPVSIVFEQEGAILRAKPYPSYPSFTDIYDGAVGGGGANAGESVKIAILHWDTTYPFVIIDHPVNWVSEIRLEFPIGFDGTIHIGDDENPERLMKATQNFPSMAGARFTVHPSQYATVDAVKLWLEDNTSTVDAGIYVRYKEPDA